VEATRRAIIASARTLFGRQGYAATSVDDIARNARVTKGAVYHHFATKEAVFRAVYDEVERDAQTTDASRRLPAGASPVELIVASMHAYLDATLDPEVQRITLIDGPHVLGNAPGGAAEDAGHRGLRDFVHDAMRHGLLLQLDPDALAHVIRGACLQGALVIARSAQQRRARQRIGAALEAMIRGLAPPG
jgi:AcrR family transcriptional regulator